MAKAYKAKINEFKGENTALATLDGGKVVVVKIPINVHRPVPGSTVAVIEHPTSSKAQILKTSATDKTPATFDEYDRFLYDAELSAK